MFNEEGRKERKRREEREEKETREEETLSLERDSRARLFADDAPKGRTPAPTPSGDGFSGSAPTGRLFAERQAER